MADATADGGVSKARAGKGLFVGLVLAALFGGGGFYVVFSGLLLGESSTDAVGISESASSGEEGFDGLSGPTVPDSLSDVSFLPVEPVIVSLAGAETGRHLRFRAELEVPTHFVSEVEHLMPRVIDVMNAYLRVVDPKDLSEPGALIAIRAQILRRLNLVIGTERVNDVLVMEFVLS